MLEQKFSRILFFPDALVDTTLTETMEMGASWTSFKILIFPSLLLELSSIFIFLLLPRIPLLTVTKADHKWLQPRQVALHFLLARLFEHQKES